MTGPGYILVWCTADEGIKNAYFSDSDEGRAALKASLPALASPLVFFVRVYREDTEAVIAQLRGKTDQVLAVLPA